MKTIIRLAVLVVTATVALALAGNALATQRLSVRQESTSLAIKVTQAQSDPQPARIVVYVPTGYTINASPPTDTKIGSTSGSAFARGPSSSVPISGDVVVAPDNTNAEGCATGTHTAVWKATLSIGGDSVDLLMHVDATTGTETSLGAYKIVACPGPSDVPEGTPGRWPDGAQLLELTFALKNIFTPPASGTRVWKAFTTPYSPGLGTENTAGTVETRSAVIPGILTLATRVVSKQRRWLRVSGALTQGTTAIAHASVNILINGKARFRARTTATGQYFTVLKKSGRKSTSTFQTRVTVAEHDITRSGCAGPSLPNVRCVSATASGFTALSRKLRVTL
jgi:hypothetical protein